jgi:hypothetical protein
MFRLQNALCTWMQDVSVKGLYPGGVVLQTWGPPSQRNPTVEEMRASRLSTCRQLARMLLPEGALEKREVRVRRLALL